VEGIARTLNDCGPRLPIGSEAPAPNN